MTQAITQIEVKKQKRCMYPNIILNGPDRYVCSDCGEDVTMLLAWLHDLLKEAKSEMNQ